jgi:hypothetical protein
MGTKVPGTREHDRGSETGTQYYYRVKVHTKIHFFLAQANLAPQLFVLEGGCALYLILHRETKCRNHRQMDVEAYLF